MKRAEIYLQEWEPDEESWSLLTRVRAWWRELKSPQSIANKFCQWNYLCKGLGDKERGEHLLKGDDILMETYDTIKTKNLCTKCDKWPSRIISMIKIVSGVVCMMQLSRYKSYNGKKVWNKISKATGRPYTN